jgi:hypothetical protein
MFFAVQKITYKFPYKCRESNFHIENITLIHATEHEDSDNVIGREVLLMFLLHEPVAGSCGHDNKASGSTEIRNITR